MWDDQFDHFAQHYRVLRYDLRGFGRSSPPERPYSHADDLKALLASLRMEPTAIVGLSFGGQVALDFALAHPQATRALVLVDAVISGWQWSSQHAASLAGVRGVARAAGADAGRRDWLRHALFAPACEQPAVARRLAEMVNGYSCWHWLNDDPRRAAESPATDRLGQLTAPTLVLVGERDLDDFQGIADLLEREIAGARKVVLRGVGHMANMEDPTRFNEVVLDFLAAI